MTGKYGTFQIVGTVSHIYDTITTHERKKDENP